MNTALLDTLTPREREVLTFIAEGHSLAEIAQKLCRSLKTIESHRLSVGRKLNASNRVELARIAISAGLVSLSPDNADRFSAPVHHGGHAGLELQWLEQINEAVYSTSGQRYIDALCEAASRVLGARYCAVCIPDPKAPTNARYTVSIAAQGRLLDPIHYRGLATPAETIAKEGACVINGGVQEAYPDDPVMASLSVHSYIGVRLNNVRGESSGVLAVLHDQPVEHAQAVERILRFFLPRTSAELARMAQEEQLRELQQKIHRYSALSTTGDAPDTTAGRADAHEAVSRFQHLMSAYTGLPLLSELANMLCVVTGVRLAAVCMRDDSQKRPELVTLVVSESGRKGETMRYPLKGTPCQIVADQGHYMLETGLAIEFPDDQWVVENGIQGYVGIRLDNKNGEQLGAVWMVDDKPLTETEQLKRLLHLLEPRIAAEVENQANLDKLYERCEQLELRISQIQTSPAQASGHISSTR